MRHRSRMVMVTALAVLGALAVVPSQPAGAAVPAGVSCRAATKAYDPLAKRMAAEITARLRGRASDVGLNLTDSKTGVTCWYHSTRHFYAASVMKVTILAALLRKAQEQNRKLTEAELHNAWLMITQSDNTAANYLWFDVGLKFMQHFLDLAKMKQTKLDYHWGLSLLTAHDEMLLLALITGPNDVLTKPSRVYARYLMAHVIADQRWGVPAGAPRGVIVHVKNGWLPYPGSLWEINSIGTFTNAHRAYLIAMLTYDNPSMGYGIDTIEGAARVIHALLNPGNHKTIPTSSPGPALGVPDEPVPPARH
ncbi:MAG TPA: serine hydrolase [Streptosporangiaceae bacterium]|nr:serine hydrolase [Streptosporangiaceae bacterium]